MVGQTTLKVGTQRHTTVTAQVGPLPEDLDKAVVDSFVGKRRPIPPRPARSRTTTVIIRKEVVSFYYAIYAHELGRFVELRYRPDPDAPMRSIPLPDSLQPQTFSK